MNAEPIDTDQRSVPDAGPRTPDVAAEMTAIFGVAARDVGADLPRSRAVVPVLAPRRGRRRLVIAIGLVALLLGVSLYLAVGGRLENQRSAVVTRDRGPSASVPPKVAAIRATPIPAVHPAVSNVAPEARSRPTPARHAARHSVSSPTRSSQSKRATDRHEHRRCGARDANARAWCLQPAILSADRALRAAYDRAVARGADRHALLAYRRHWTKLQRRATREPDDAVREMRMMAHDLSLLGR